MRRKTTRLRGKKTTRKRLEVCKHGPDLATEYTRYTDTHSQCYTDVTDHQVPFPPPGLKEISSLASWTVSTCKPGNGVAALRSSSPSHFWQSDGPQPHYLTIHFFKLVHIVHMRLYVDFAQDESYTPTKMQFWAGMAMHDLELFSEMALEQPTGWVDDGEIDWSKRPVLRAFVVQVKILENHQNGKDTHLRAVQLFARDEGMAGRGASGNMDVGSVAGSFVAEVPLRTKKKFGVKKANNIKMAEWMMDPEMR
ncbi:galactose-binding like protein [Polychaeton citri CBS 116435]|uniref:Galactose-binding like protein n=1 Tax=Polychaeton citri CBS 116435 TaxID=1314669 RepID=A0A9P4PYH4_9PEZI|nr:galactose-binding like protein [Polychaeton citri CBS 116435]